MMVGVCVDKRDESADLPDDLAAWMEREQTRIDEEKAELQRQNEEAERQQRRGETESLNLLLERWGVPVVATEPEVTIGGQRFAYSRNYGGQLYHVATLPYDAEYFQAGDDHGDVNGIYSAADLLAWLKGERVHQFPAPVKAKVSAEPLEDWTPYVTAFYNASDPDKIAEYLNICAGRGYKLAQSLPFVAAANRFPDDRSNCSYVLLIMERA
jgi:hypothetical protein